MSVITFWSSNEKAIGQTVAAASAATVMAIEHNYKVLLVSVDFNDTTIENCFGKQETNKAIINSLVKKNQINFDSGINGLLKLVDSNRVTPDAIHDYTKIIFKNRLEVLYSPIDSEENKNTTILLEKMRNIIQNASRYYDHVFVDLKKGLKYKEQLEILQMSDVIVTNIEQGTKTIEKIFSMKDVQQFLDKMIWNLCRYDKKSKYNTKNLTRSIFKRKPLYETHYNTLVAEATQEGNLVELLIRFKTLKDEDDNTLFISKIEELNEGILLKYQETQTRK